MPPRLRVMSYNIRNARGTDNRVDLARIAGVIASFEPDIVALQEVDAHRARSGHIDQAAQLGATLGMSVQYTACLVRGHECYGLATLTRLPIVEALHLELPTHVHLRTEPRRALVTRHAWPVPGASLAMVNTHLSTHAAERPGQVAAIAEWLPDPEMIIAGDLNCTIWSRALKPLMPRVRSATKHARTWPARAPLFPIDHILVAGPLSVVESGSWKLGGARRASDHLPVVAVLEAA